METETSFFDDVIAGRPIVADFTITRAKLIGDGLLIEAPATIAREAGIGCPVALTAAVWDRFVKVPAGEDHLSESSRLWDLLFAMRMAIGRNPQQSSLTFPMPTMPAAGDDATEEEIIAADVDLDVISGPGDHGEQVITVKFPLED